jgi:ribosome biogenesis protein YTM1
MESSGEDEKIEVKFITKLDQLRVTEKPFRVPISLGRAGLSGVINHLLSLDPPKPFDFLIGNELLRTSLAKFVGEKQITTETGLVIEYIELAAAPNPEIQTKQDDWVSAVCGSFDGVYLSGSYDKIVRIFDSKTSTLKASCVGHTDSITAISPILDQTSSLNFVTSSKDHTLRIWNVNAETSTVKCEAICKHKGPVEDVVISPLDSSKFVSASGDKTALLWDTKTFVPPNEKQPEQPIKSKKRKAPEQDLELQSVLKFEGHTQTISSVSWAGLFNQIITGSWDHSIRTWDGETGTSTRSLIGDSVIYDLSYSGNSGLIVTGHSDNAIRLWYPRSSEALVFKKLVTHKGWVHSVSWKPDSEHVFVSGSYDHTIKIWDIRSTIPLHTLQLHTDKVLCLAWDLSGGKLLSGGADCVLQIFKVT